MSIAEIVAMTRDIAFLSMLLVIMVVSLVLYLKISALVGSGKRIAENTEEVVSSLSTRFTEYAGAGLNLASSTGQGNIAALVAYQELAKAGVNRPGRTRRAGLDKELAWNTNHDQSRRFRRWKRRRRIIWEVRAMGPDSMFGGGVWIIFPIIMIPVMFTFMYLMFVRGGHGPPWRDSGSHHSESGKSETTSDISEILRRRYASGEITREEFDQMNEDLSGQQR